MPAPKQTRKTENIAEHLSALQHPLKPLVLALNDIILSADPAIAGQVKWNSPAYYYTGEMADADPKTYPRDVLVINLYKPDSVLLVFPTGARIADASGLLQGKFTDGRKTVLFHTLEEVQQRNGDLTQVLKQWLDGVKTGK